MICSKCGKSLDNNPSFCPYCGTKVVTMPPSNKSQLNKKQKIIILALSLVIIILLGMIALVPGGANGTRTIMIYVVGSNLETDSGIVTADLASIDPNNIDTSKTNVLLYTGGTEKWHNYINNNENGIYILKKSGFQKLESEKQYNLGDPSTLTNFLKYGYTKYKADKYDLILYDHGGAIDGAIYDDISSDHLTLDDMKEALNNSPFNKNNKLEAVLFRTCLNGTIELANVFSPYADYLIGSEEISWGSPYTSVLNFINDLDGKDNGKEFGIKFINAYEEQMKVINFYNDHTYTYSVIDLSKIDKFNQQLDEYVKSIDVTTNYKSISKIRANMYQYGSTDPSFDMVDLYEFINNMQAYASVDSTKLINTMNELIIYNNSNEESSHGLSIYFPYNGRKGQQNMFLSVYENLNYSSGYRNFIKTFNTIGSNPSGFSFNIKDNEITKEDTTKKVSLKLTEEQVENYAYATFTILEKDEEHPDYYWLLLNSDDVQLSSDGLLTANYENSFVKIYDKDDEKEYYLNISYRKKYGRKTTAILYGKEENIEEKLQSELAPIVDLYISNDSNGNPIASSAKLKSNNEYLDGILLKLDNYDTYNLSGSRKRILDENGDVLELSEWESPPVLHYLRGPMEELKTSLKYTNLSKGDNYYAIFFITDVNGEVSYSKLIKVGE